MSGKVFSLWALAIALAGRAPAQVAILQMKVIEGEGAVHAPGSRAARPLTVEVTDETGKPLEGAAVSFHLPDEGAGGSFANGLRTDVVITDVRGQATVRTLVLNRIPGRFQVRIVASKEQARAGIVSFQYIAEPKGGGTGSVSAAGSGSHRVRWIVILAVAGAGAAAAGIAAGHSGAQSSTVASIPAGPVTAPGISIGAPSITVGHP